jgi:dipeptidyl aminopeptidase/acylaminoacyl peptidase
MTPWRFWWCSALLLPALAAADVEQRTLNDGNLILEDIPEISEEIVVKLLQFQNVRSAGFSSWTNDGTGLYISTGFGDVVSLHHVTTPLGSRWQRTYFDEPMGQIVRRPGRSEMLITRDAGGSEFSQIFKLDPHTGNADMLTDGESRNGTIVWDRLGARVAYQSTRRNGASNDIWIMDPDEPDDAGLVLEATDGSWWGPAEFSSSGSKLLASNYVSVSDSRIHIIDLDTGATQKIAGGAERKSVNYPVGFDDENNGVWMITNQDDEFERLAWQSIDADSALEIISAEIPWNVTDATVSHNRERIAFVTNENGLSKIYLLDTKTRDYRRIDVLPAGRVFNVRFGPHDRRLAMTLNTAQSPSDVYVLDLGSEPLDYRQLTRWTESEVGGIDKSVFRSPELIHYPTFDKVDGKPREIPAWVYKPVSKGKGKGPHPVVISIHGGPESQARPSFSSTYQMWIDKLGVAVIRPNVRGSNGYGKTYLSLDNGFKREDSVKDIGALLDWIETQPDLDADRVAVFGGSYGGYMVLASAVNYSDRLSAAVDVVGISNFVTFLENTQDYRRDLRRVEYGDERNPAMREYLQSISPLNNVGKIKIPMFIVQGENDPRVPVTESAQIVEALRKEGHTVWYMNALNEGHGYKKRENRDVYQQATVLFLEQHLVND